MAKYRPPSRRILDVSDLPAPRVPSRRTYDRPFTVNCDVDVLDDNGDILASIHQLPRSVEEGMQVLISRPEGQLPARVVDVDRFYGLVSLRPEG
jgi:hypothetical protein